MRLESPQISQILEGEWTRLSESSYGEGGKGRGLRWLIAACVQTCIWYIFSER